MERGRRLESKFCRLESSQRANRVSIRSSISSLSSSDFSGKDAGDEVDDDPAIRVFPLVSFLFFSAKTKKVGILGPRSGQIWVSSYLLVAPLFIFLSFLAALKRRQRGGPNCNLEFCTHFFENNINRSIGAFKYLIPNNFILF